MDKFHISLIALVLMTLSIHTAKGQITNANELTECWKCSGSEDCGDRDSCLAEHDRCLKLKYEHDGGFVNEARCSKRTECDTEAVALRIVILVNIMVIDVIMLPSKELEKDT
ncbi:uncharacterized protein [Clytia hemisphaerica]|uniref:uncharacterized protein n=1 Tax=Clytia hemisphaerica TaxID=252671 RepID=UPI0034D60F56